MAAFGQVDRYRMKQLVVIGSVLLLTACAGQSYTYVPVEEKGYGQPLPRPTTAASPSTEATQSARSVQSGVEPSASGKPSASTKPLALAKPSSPSPSPSPSSVPAPKPELPPTALPSFKPPTPVAPASSRRYTGPSPALLALIEQAGQYESQGNPQAALAQLERAQRIAPRDPMVYLQLARLRLHMNDRSRTEQLARRGLSLAGGDPDLESAFKVLLDELKR